MIKFIFSLIFIILLEACNLEKPILYESFQAVSCKSKNELKKYIFNKNNGKLYFYDYQSEKFFPLTNNYDQEYYGKFSTEIYSVLKNNKLNIIKLNYRSISNNEYFKIEDILDLKSLILKTTYIDDNDKFISRKFKCIWIDPRLGIK